MEFQNKNQNLLSAVLNKTLQMLILSLTLKLDLAAKQKNSISKPTPIKKITKNLSALRFYKKNKKQVAMLELKVVV